MTLEELSARLLVYSSLIEYGAPVMPDCQTLREAARKIKELSTTQRKLAFLIDRIDFATEEMPEVGAVYIFSLENLIKRIKRRR